MLVRIGVAMVSYKAVEVYLLCKFFVSRWGISIPVDK